MAQNFTQSSHYEDEVDLHEIIIKLIESKKLIIQTILIFTLTAFSIFNFYKNLPMNRHP